ncbi:MAG: tetratricopeptide repeat protein [Lachnospiraceae bacterium]|nr:tetratricopeptide repeat protein [Lachnospiraceae bacterium]
MGYAQEIINKSYAWYNEGLRKAKIRDLSGAILALRRSLQYHRENVEARNLLGLVFYGRGEVAEALVEWIISKSFQRQDNIADYFINKIQRTSKDLEVVNQAVKKYNQALLVCEQNGDDMAIIQLKKAVADHPNFLRAMQLLALLYLHTEQYTKARQVLVKARKIDTTNDTTLRYIHAMTQIRGSKPRRSRRKKATTMEYTHGNETIIQPRHSLAREISSRVMVWNVLIGVLIGAAVVWYLVAPAVNQSRNAQINQQMIEYAQRIQSLEAQVSAQTRALDEYRQTEAAQETTLADIEEVQATLEGLIAVQEQFNSGNFTMGQLAANLLEIDRTLLAESGQETYDHLRTNIFPPAAQNAYALGMESFAVANWSGAIDQLSLTVRIDERFEEGAAMLHLAIALESSGNTEDAVPYFHRIIELFPDTELAEEARSHLEEVEA